MSKDYTNHGLMVGNTVRDSTNQRIGKIIERGARRKTYYVVVEFSTGERKTYENQKILNLSRL